MIIARLAAGLRCYEPERADAVWARLRRLGGRRLQLAADATAAVNQIRDLLECPWPAVLDASRAVPVGDLARTGVDRGNAARQCAGTALIAAILSVLRVVSGRAK